MPKNNRNANKNLKQELTMVEHRITIDELAALLKTDMTNGKTTQDVESQYQKDGPNALTPPPDNSKLVMFLEQLFGGFQILLWIGSFLCFTAYTVTSLTMGQAPKDNLYLGIVLATIVIMTGLFAYYQEAKSSSIMESFKKLVPQQATVVRDGNVRIISADKLVVGDLVNITSGDRIPADIRILSSSNFKVDNSALTGESEPQSRNCEFTNENPLETKNLAFFTTMAVEGNAKGVVVNTGDRTVMGRIAILTTNISGNVTPIRREINHFIKIITYIAMATGLLVFLSSLLMGNSWIQAVLFLIGVIIATVPEGLLPTVTVALTLTAKRMASKNCLVRNLESVETLGSTSVICSDKTGTLTQNRMTVAHAWFDDTVNELDTTGMDISDEIKEKLLESQNWIDLATVAILCNNAEFEADQESVPIYRRTCNGTGSEIGLLKCFERYYGETNQIRKENPMMAEIPFTSATKLHYQVRRLSDGHNYILMKGAPERVIASCDSISIKEQLLPIDRDIMNSFHQVYEELGGMGERVLGFALRKLETYAYPDDYKFDTDTINFPLNGLHFIGLVSMIDPPRASVPTAVEKCKKAGIKVVMVTGDHPITAGAIARHVGIIDPGAKLANDVSKLESIPLIKLRVPLDPSVKAIIINGNDLKEFQPEDLKSFVKNYEQIVFARTSPQQKLIIVEAFQKCGKIVAVTGDGVNDSPALKQADIGIAMGITGSDVSKQAADMVLLDDNFASIIVGVEEGRIIFDNLKKTIAYTLSSKIPELIPFLSYLLFGLPLPLGPITILLIDLGADLLPAISVAYETAESNIMTRPPRDAATSRLVSMVLISVSYGHYGVYNAFAGFFTYFIIMSQNGFLPTKLLYIREKWDDESIVALQDSYGQEWDFKQRKSLEATAQTGFFCSIVIMQWFVLFICKTRLNSFFRQGMHNMPMNLALFAETILVLIVTYFPCENIINTYPLYALWWLPAFPFGISLFIQDEIRKFFIRKYPGNWIEQETFY